MSRWIFVLLWCVEVFQRVEALQGVSEIANGQAVVGSVQGSVQSGVDESRIHNDIHETRVRDDVHIEAIDYDGGKSEATNLVEILSENGKAHLIAKDGQRHVVQYSSVENPRASEESRKEYGRQLQEQSRKEYGRQLQEQSRKEDGRQLQEQSRKEDGRQLQEEAVVSANHDSAPRRQLYIENAQFYHDTAQAANYGTNQWALTSNVLTETIPGTLPSTTRRLLIKQGLQYKRIIFKSNGDNLQNAWAKSTTDKSSVRLIHYEPTGLGSTLCNKNTKSLIETGPFNGGHDGASFNTWDIADPPTFTTVKFLDVIFPIAGQFQLCYSRDDIIFEILKPIIEVEGSSSKVNRFWCPYVLIHKNGGCSDNVPASTCYCKGLISGFQDDGTTLAILGYQPHASVASVPSHPTLNYPLNGQQFKLGLSLDQECGFNGGQGLAAPFENKEAAITTNAKNLLMDFGVISTDQSVFQGAYKLCYCVHYDADGASGNNAICNVEYLPSFATHIGMLVVTSVRTFYNGSPIGTYPVLKWELTMECGCARDAQTPCPESRGGCSDSNSKRYKISRQSATNNQPYYEDTNGCRFAAQAVPDSDPLVRLYKGGQTAPVNCPNGAATGCTHEPKSGQEKRWPTWEGVQIAPDYRNGVMLTSFYDVCYCDNECEVPSNWFKAGVLQVRPLQAIVKTTDELSLETPPVINLDISIGVMTNKDVIVNEKLTGFPADGIAIPNKASFASINSGESTREMKIVEDPDGFITSRQCIQYEQPRAVAGHGQISAGSLIDYDQPAGLVDQNGKFDDSTATVQSTTGYYGYLYGFVKGVGGVADANTIKIQKAGYFAICYCDSECNKEVNWANIHRQIIAGPTFGQKWDRPPGISFEISITGNRFQNSNRIIALDPAKEITDCGTAQRSTKVYGPGNGGKPILSSGSSAIRPNGDTSPSKIKGIERDPNRGSILEFTDYHGLQDDDEIYLTVTMNTAALKANRGLTGDEINELSAMYNNLHKISVLCDNVAGVDMYGAVSPGKLQCHKVIIPVYFSASDFPHLPPTDDTNTNLAFTAYDWTRTNKQTFIMLKVTETTQRGYIICWARDDLDTDDASDGDADDGITIKNYQAPVGQLVVGELKAMAGGYLSPTSIEESDGDARVSPMILTFRTGSSVRYSEAAKSMGLKVVFLNRVNDQVVNAQTVRTFVPVITPYDSEEGAPIVAKGANDPAATAQLKRSTNTETLRDLIPKATQAMCGQIFLEMWGEHENSFPQPKSCFSHYDDSAHALNALTGENPTVELYVFFHPKNGLAPNTEYQLVFNAIFTSDLSDSNFDAMQVYTLDENFGQGQFNIVEYAICKVENHKFPASLASNKWRNYGPGNVPELAHEGGFEVLDDADDAVDNYVSIPRYCLRSDGSGLTPSLENECKPCEREEDCGNGIVGNGNIQAVPPNEDLNWCSSPIEISCFANPQQLDEHILLSFKLRPHTDSYPLPESSIVSIFMHPFTLWDLGQNPCELFYQSASGGANNVVESCTKRGVTSTKENPTDEFQQTNYLEIKLPTTIIKGNEPTFKLGGQLPVPKWGFLPQYWSAEWKEEKGKKARYLSQKAIRASSSPPNPMVFVRPWIPTARILTAVGVSNGNQKPFSQQDNTLYIQFVFGSHLFENYDDYIQLRIAMPQDPAAGNFKCKMEEGGLRVPDDVAYIKQRPTPNGFGTLGSHPKGVTNSAGELVSADHTKEVTWGTQVGDPFCLLTFKKGMIALAGTSIFVKITVQNPEALKISSKDNYWLAYIDYEKGGAPKMADHPDSFSVAKRFSPRTYSGIPPYERQKATESEFSANVPILGKLEMAVIQPDYFAAGVIVNYITVFVRTKQDVGYVSTPLSQLWVDAPPNFDFSQYCIVQDLEELYYAEEPLVPTSILPRKQATMPPTCMGGQVASEQSPDVILKPGVYNRARISINGRLLGRVLYGFQLRIRNVDVFTMAQRNEWKIWTLENEGTEFVDATEFSPRFNQEHPGRPDSDPTGLINDPWVYDAGEPNHSWAIYLEDLPSEPGPGGDPTKRYSPNNFLVTLGDMRPNPQKNPTEITVFPIMLESEIPDPVHVRVSAPHGYVWDFRPSEFLYESLASGVTADRAVPGTELDLPLALVPPKPLVKPFNELKMNYLLDGFRAKKRYGFKTKIVVPANTATDALNRFTIEFGYDELVPEKRYAVGICPSPMVRKLLNAFVDYKTSHKNVENRLKFSFQTITPIGRGGGIVITGPANFGFAEACLPLAIKPPPGVSIEAYQKGSKIGEIPNLDLPFDVTCTSVIDPTTKIPVIKLTAGPDGLPAKSYSFYLDVQNPEFPVSAEAQTPWIFQSFPLVSVTDATQFLDYQTEVSPFGITETMPMAGLVQSPKNWDCGADFQNCNNLPHYWQYTPPRGYRDDRPKTSSVLAFKFTLKCNTDDGLDGELHPECKKAPDTLIPGELPRMTMKINAPEGFVFDLNCRVEVDSTKVFYAANPNTMVPTGFTGCCGESDVAIWPSLVEVKGCVGRNNKASIEMFRGLKAGKVYVFNIAIQTTPQQTPTHNFWTIELNGEASQEFSGYGIWGFYDYSIEPRDTSVSNRVGAVQLNEVTIELRPFNFIGLNGYFRIQAPNGFEVPTDCYVDVEVDEPEIDQYCALENTLTQEELQLQYGVAVRWCSDALGQKNRWTDFSSIRINNDNFPGMTCKGDEKPSNNVELYLGQTKVMLPMVKYRIKLRVKNPLGVQQEREVWKIKSYREKAFNPDESKRLLDSSEMPGFVINFQVSTFKLYPPSTRNAIYPVIFKFEMAFPRDIVNGERIDILTPVGYMLALQGTTSCTEYTHLGGFLSRTKPICGGNMISWLLKDDRAPAENLISFSLLTVIPARTPDPNYFKIRVLDMATETMIASKVEEGLSVIPSLLDLKIETTVPELNTLVETGNEHSCRGHIFEAYKFIKDRDRACESTESLTTVRIQFTTNSAANLVRLTGWVFSGIPQSLSTGKVPSSYENIELPENRIQLESYRSPPEVGISGNNDVTNRIRFTYVDPVRYPSVQYNGSEVLLIPLNTEKFENGAQVSSVQGVGAGETVTISVPRVLYPQISGVLIWDVATFTVKDNSDIVQLPWDIDIRDSNSVQKKDEFLQYRIPEKDSVNLHGRHVLPHCGIVPGASTLFPAQFETLNAKVHMEVQIDAMLYKDEIMMITRPPGYRYRNSSFVPISDTILHDQSLGADYEYEHGLDYKYSQNPLDSSNSPERYWFRLPKMIYANSILVFEFNVDVPIMPYDRTYWFVDFYYIRPLVDADENILQSEPGDYPWDQDLPTFPPLAVKGYGGTPHRWKRRMTNDGAFTGFFLVGGMGSVQLQPLLRTPGAQTSVKIQIVLDNQVKAPSSEDTLRLEIEAPPNYRFQASALGFSADDSAAFGSCNGNNNKAICETAGNTIGGISSESNGIIRFTLVTTNPPIHHEDPAINRWRLQLFRGQETQPANVGSVSGYRIKSMFARYQGPNRVGGTGTAFLSFKSNSIMPRGGSLLIIPPQPNGGFDLTCVGKEKLDLLEDPSCFARGINMPLQLELPTTALAANVEYTFGIGVVNPSHGGHLLTTPEEIAKNENLSFEKDSSSSTAGSSDSSEDSGSASSSGTSAGMIIAGESSDPSEMLLPTVNKWGLKLVSREGNTIDANMGILGQPLVKIDIVFSIFAWSQAKPESMNAILIEFNVIRYIRESTVEYFSIESPEGVMFTSVNEAIVIGEALTLIPNRPFRIAGNELIVAVDMNSPIREGIIGIQFNVKTPSQVPAGNIWIVKAKKGSDVVLSEVLPGYLYGQQSPRNIMLLPSIVEGNAQVKNVSTIIVIMIISWILRN